MILTLKSCRVRSDADVVTTTDSTSAQSDGRLELTPQGATPQATTRLTKGLAAAPPVVDRRRSSRAQQKIPGWVSADSSDRQGRGGSVTVVDLSLHGLGFHDESRRFSPGSTHWVVVSGDSLRLSTRVRVVSCRPSREGGYDVGAAFF